MERFAAGRHEASLIAGYPGRWVVIAPPDRSMVLAASRPRVAALRRAYLDAPYTPLTPQAQAKVSVLTVSGMAPAASRVRSV